MPPRSWTYANLAIPASHPTYRFRKRAWATSHSFRRLRQLAQGHPINDHSWYSAGNGYMHTIHCAEHRRDELIPSGNHQDLRPWYDARRHPRWSIVGVLLDAKQQYNEINRALRNWVSSVLRTHWQSQARFLRGAQPHLMTTIRFQRRPVRVDQRFAERYRREAFTVRMWFEETNQERRRMMMRRGVKPADVEAQLGLPIAEDAEGKLYRREPALGADQRYLAVECPSTHERYLIQVPEVDTDRGNQIRREYGEARTAALLRAGIPAHTYLSDRQAREQRAGIPPEWGLLTAEQREALLEPALLNTPAKARRWTFRLPMDAEFAAEA